MVFAGPWETWKSAEGTVIESCTILTIASNRLLAGLHDRMPVILSRDELAGWLDRNTTNPAGLAHLFQPYPADMMDMYPVSPLVNSPKNDSADLIMPVGDSQFLDLGCSK
jgi:putative SOS response-associated peptidase YedK